MRETPRGLAWAQFPGLTDRFTNTNQATKWLVGQGIGYHAQTMWRDVSTLFQKAAKLPLQREYSPFEHIPQNLFVERDWKRPESYNYYGNTFFEDPATGEQFMRSYSIYADTSLTDREVRDLVYAQEEEREEEYGPEWKVVGFESMERSHKWGAVRSTSYGIAEI